MFNVYRNTQLIAGFKTKEAAQAYVEWNHSPFHRDNINIVYEA